MLKEKIFLFMILISSVLLGQNLLNQPESVVYDSLYNRYLVSNWGSGDVVQIDSTGIQSVFIDNEHCYAGLHIKDNVLYVACRQFGVKGFSLETNENVLDIYISGATNINDITSDNSGNLYVSYPTGDKIFKINIATEECWTFVEEGLDVPNGLFFDEINNRLLVVSYRLNTSIQEVNLADSTALVVLSPGLHNFDGITQDNEGNYYISSWQSNRVYKFNNMFSGSYEIFSNHNDDPADIFFDKVNNVLAVPLFFTNQIEFIETVTDIGISGDFPASEAKLFKNYPNPFNPATTIKFTIQNDSSVEIVIYNTKGQKIKTLANGEYEKGNHSIIWKGDDEYRKSVSSGIYLYQLNVNEKIEAMKKCLLLK